MQSYFIKETDLNRKEYNFDWKYIDKIADSFTYIKSDDKAKKDLLENVKLTLKNVSYPSSNNKRSILVVGKVQSGKTTNFSCLSAGCIDMGYDIIIILGGTNNALLSQNLKRAKASFNDESIYIFDNMKIKNIDPLVIQSYLENRYKIILCVMKEASHLDNLIKIFDGSPLYDRSIAIIDDEGDLASLSNALNARKTINEKLKILSQNIFSTSTYISYTATPQGNLLIPKKSWQSPDFINYIEPNDKIYCGLKAYHSRNTDKIIEIEEGFKDLEFAIRRALYTYVIHLIDSDFSGNTDLEMIIHSARINEEHENIYSSVNNTINKILASSINDIIHLSKLEFNYDKNVEKEMVKKLNHYILSSIFVQKLYGNQNTKLEKQENTSLIIYIGGDMLGRGVTFFPIVTFLTRTSNIFFMDALLQRARWFGYRKNYKVIGKKSLYDVSKIYMESRNKKAFESILKNDRAIWGCMRVLTDFLIDPKNIVIPLVSDDLDLLPTNKEKLSEYKKPKIVKGLKKYDMGISQNCFDRSMSVYNLYGHINKRIEVSNKYFEMLAISNYLNIKKIYIRDNGLIYLNIEKELYVYGR